MPFDYAELIAEADTRLKQHEERKQALAKIRAEQRAQGLKPDPEYPLYPFVEVPAKAMLDALANIGGVPEGDVGKVVKDLRQALRPYAGSEKKVSILADQLKLVLEAAGHAPAPAPESAPAHAPRARKTAEG